jgi:hypothetical protein
MNRLPGKRPGKMRSRQKCGKKKSLESKNDNNLFSSKFDARSKVIYHILL